MGRFFEVLGEPTNKLYVDGEEIDCSNKMVNINRASFSGWDEVDITSAKPTIHDSMVIYNNEVHFIGSSKADPTVGMHCKFDGANWTTGVSTLPYNAAFSKALVYNDEIHIFGGHPNSGNGDKKDYKSQKYHYKLNKNTNQWEKVATLPYYFYSGSACVHAGKMHIFGGGRTSDTQKKHYVFNPKTNTWKAGTALNQRIWSLYKAFSYVTGNGDSMLYFVGQKDKSTRSVMYRYDSGKKKWVTAFNFEKSLNSAEKKNFGFIDAVVQFGDEWYIYGTNNWNAASTHNDSLKGMRFHENTGVFQSFYNFTDQLSPIGCGYQLHLFFYKGECYIFNEDATFYRHNGIVYNLEMV